MSTLPKTPASDDVLWTADECVAATDGVWLGRLEESNMSIKGVSIDTRTLKAGDLFIALKGENFDGNEFIGRAFEKGAAAVVANKDTIDAMEEDRLAGLWDKPVLIVESTDAALKALGVYRRAQIPGKVIGITGSVGKTSLKEAMAFVFGFYGKTSQTKGNLNNRIGVALSLCRMPRDCEFGIFEAGISHPGEMPVLSDLLKPDLCVITTISPTHSEFLGDLMDIALAKAQIMDSMPKGSLVVLNRDNPLFPLLYDEARRRGLEAAGFGCHPQADARMIDYAREGDYCRAYYAVGKAVFNYFMVSTGRQIAILFSAIIFILLKLHHDPSKALHALSRQPDIRGRGALSRLPHPDGGEFVVYDETYNASPASMRAAIENLAETEATRHLAILGDMGELGEGMTRHHVQLAKIVADENIDLVFTCGRAMVECYHALESSKRGGGWLESSQAAKEIPALVRPGDAIMIKGSRFMEMENIFKALVEFSKSSSAQNNEGQNKQDENKEEQTNAV